MTPAVFLLSGALFVVSAANSEGTDLRPGRYTDLASLVQTESDQYDELEQQVRELDAEVTNLAAGVKDANVRRFQRKVQSLKDPAGLTPRAGPGLTVTLSDAPEEVLNSSTQDPNLLVVHQQDIQAVVNAMWKGGARAVTVQGQRIVSTTGIRCEGNSVQLQGVPYPQPYVISAVGDQAALEDAIEDDDYLDVYRVAGRAGRHLGRLGRRVRDAGHRAAVRRPARHRLRPADPAERQRRSARVAGASVGVSVGRASGSPSHRASGGRLGTGLGGLHEGRDHDGHRGALGRPPGRTAGSAG